MNGDWDNVSAANYLPIMAHPDPDAILAALDPEQREVAAAPLGPMRVIAGAGTGKTRAITHRIAYGVRSGQLNAPQVLALTFTARAAGEMRTRLRDLGVAGVQARTFHAAALRQVHYFWPKVVGGGAPEVMASKAAAVAEASGRLRLRLTRDELRDAAAEIEWAKVGMLTAETYARAATRARRTPPGMDVTAMARLMSAYEEVKDERGVIDFEDVLLVTLGMIRKDARMAQAVHEQYRHFVVDEYQDVNALQQALLLAWLGDRHDLCVVGDPAQTIYSFTGASADHLRTFPSHHPGAVTHELVRNYRSSPQIVALANGLARGPSGSRRWGGVELLAQREAGPEPVLTAYDDDPAEAAGVAALIAKAIAAGTSPREIAILFRTNGQSEAFESALSHKDIPYLVRGGERFFQRREVREAIVLLRGGARSDDGSTELPELVRTILGGAGWAALAPVGGGAARERWESLEAIAVLADQFVAGMPAATLPDFLRELDERAAAQHAPAVEGVTLASLHAAKGLEWDVVVLAGVSDGLLPIVMAETNAEIDEERRLLYVGMTRARRALHLTWARSKVAGGRASRRPSRFLGGLVEGASAPSAGNGGKPSKPSKVKKDRLPARCRTCGEVLASAAERTTGRCATCPATYDEATFEALKTWRSAVAKTASWPAYVVFTDATLTAIAETKPADAAALTLIPGVGQRKLTLYGASVLAVLGGADPAQAAAQITKSDLIR
ncbi:ATP-dependent DNA helicase UvrD2 [Nostocoides veronense]|uniref:DNA 3'-5' helicase n=2 Tax=Nostocoides veronense TaxID=330836 RepID=A0ABN2LY33_9MICO